jgi:uncharacterized protein (TIGR02646 family)
MKRITRRSLSLTTRATLYKRRLNVQRGTPAAHEWKAFRQSKDAEPVVDALTQMVGKRKRCMYCRDSRVSDIEHFAPITGAPALTFSWSNHLWACTPCNRSKGNRFPRDDNGFPLLWNPATDWGWRLFVYDPYTGNIAPRWRAPNALDPQAEATLELISPLNDEAVTEGRLQASRRLKASAMRWLEKTDDSSRRELVGEFRDDDTGLGAWFTLFEGCQEGPWPELRKVDRRLWRRLAGVSG